MSNWRSGLAHDLRPLASGLPKPLSVRHKPWAQKPGCANLEPSLDEGYRLARHKHPGTALGLWPAPGRTQRNPTSCFYYFFMAIVVIRYETNTAARRALTFIVRIFVNDTIAITVWASFYFHGRTLGMSGAEPFLRLGNDLRFSLWSALPRGKNEVRRCYSRASCLHRNERFRGRFDSGMGIAEIRC